LSFAGGAKSGHDERRYGYGIYALAALLSGGYGHIEKAEQPLFAVEDHSDKLVYARSTSLAKHHSNRGFVNAFRFYPFPRAIRSAEGLRLWTKPCRPLVCIALCNEVDLFHGEPHLTITSNLDQSEKNVDHDVSSPSNGDGNLILILYCPSSSSISNDGHSIDFSGLPRNWDQE
jgi:hypothetical protein